jgi:hypothetical protein
MPSTVLAEHQVNMPAGSTAQRPSPATAGMTRYNTTTNKLEYYNGTLWQGLETLDTDPYWSSVVLYLRGGSTTDLKGRHTIVPNNVSTTSSPGKPFSTAESSAWYNLGASSNYYLDVQNNITDFDPQLYTNFTIEFWLWPGSTGSNYGHFYNIGGQDNQGVIKYWASDGIPYWYSSNGQLIGWGSGGLNQWKHYVYEKNGSTNTTWVNGTRTSQTTNTLPGGNPSFLRLGLNFGSETATHYFDELRITTVARYNGAASIPIQIKSWPTVG